MGWFESKVNYQGDDWYQMNCYNKRCLIMFKKDYLIKNPFNYKSHA